MQNSPQDYSLDFAYAGDQPQARAALRATPADFKVDERLGFALEGSGEHIYLQIEKTGLNSLDVARQIARLARVRPMDVGHAGLKDRHAITRQWFSLYWPKGEAPDWQQLESAQLKVLAVTRHRQKLRPGQHGGNLFELRLCQFEGDPDVVETRLQRITSEGFPNYFGPQRFGIGGGNLATADRLLLDKQPIKDRRLRGLALSAARSYLFNLVLSERVVGNCWRALMTGDIALDNLPTGPLWGRGRLQTQAEALALETAVVAQRSGWCEGLEHVGLNQERRALCLIPEALSWRFEPQADGMSMVLTFTLPPGGYATSLVREVCQTELPDRAEPAGDEAD